MPNPPDLKSSNPTGQRAALICNARSRRGQEWFPLVRDQLTAQKLDLGVAVALNDPAKVRPAVEKAIAEGYPLVIVGGGDGTMSSTAAAFKGRSSVMGVLPLGTGNAFARDLGIPGDVEGACSVLVDGSPCDVDLGVVGDRHFVNVATVGLTTRIVASLTDDAKKKYGRLAYAMAIIRAAATMKPFRATITKSSGVETFESMQIVFGSGRFHAGPFPITPDAEITDRVLHGYAVKSTTKGALLRYLLTLWGGHHVFLPEVEEFRLTRARLETQPRRRVIIDGEVGPFTPVDLAIDPAAIQVMVARDFPGASGAPRSQSLVQAMESIVGLRQDSRD